MSNFIGRQLELNQLLELTTKNTASFVLVKGRRRIGKSRLIQEFSKYFDEFHYFVGLAPDKGTTSADQLNEFSRQISRTFKTSLARYDDWSDALWAVGERVQSRKVLLFFDEISWMGSKDRTFLGKIKNFWDVQLKNNDKLIFIVCGSASSWIEKNILSNTGFVGRISFTLTLEELPLCDCNKFWPKNISVYEKLKILALTGGVPKYLEEINPKQSAENNIKKLCFTKGGFLVEEFSQIFSDLFTRKSTFYKQIIIALANGGKTQQEISQLISIKKYGRIYEYLQELELAGFIARDYTWNIRTGNDSDLSKYRLKDNYLHFYLKYIEKNLGKINRNAFGLKSLVSLPGWYTILGLQFENLVLHNRKSIHRLLMLNADDIICENPFFQRKTSRTLGCQIDYMIQTKFNTLYICEIKFSKNEIDSLVIQEVQAKIDALKFPKGFSYRPILIHVNGVNDAIIDSNYFAAIIDFGELLQVEVNV
jgi:uncharacterized protein